MHFFQELGANVQQRWKKQNFDDAVFAEVAHAALEAMPPAGQTSYWEILHWALNADELPPQDLKSGFGEPPLIVYKSDLFYIEALFWLAAQTEIHEHSFAGAFHVLEGSSLHCRYEFELRKRINSRFLLGDVRLRSAECLMKGDTRPIHPGKQSSHFVFHLEKPTVTIVIRTPVNEEARPQRAYVKPSLAIDGFSRREVLTRQLQLLDLLQRAGDPEYAQRAARLVSRSDPEAAFWVLDHAHRNADAEQFAHVLAAARKQHGDLPESFPPILRAMRRAERINSRCAFLEKAEHRLLLGLVHAMPNRAAIFKFLRAQYEADPVELITKWVQEMTATGSGEDGQANALGIRFDEASLLLFRFLLEGLSFDETRERLIYEYEADDVDAQQEQLRALFAALRESVLFEPLFTAGEAPNFEIVGSRWKPALIAQRLLARAAAATRGLIFPCSLGTPPIDLLPARARQKLSANGALIVNPTLRHVPAGNRENEHSFLSPQPLLWIENPGTQLRLPFSIDETDAAALGELTRGAPAPAAVDEQTRETLTLANILVAPGYVESAHEEWRRIHRAARAEFRARGYTVVRDLIDPLPLAAMRRYYRELVASGRLLLGDGQVDRRYALYNEPLARFFHLQLNAVMARVAGEAVKPTYVYFAAYQPGAVLARHLDRPQCEFSISLLVDYTPEPQDLSDWPLYVQPKKESTATALHQGLGDAVFYKGCEVVHFREALPENHSSTSLFFHFVPQDFAGELA